ncbi:MAG: putative damage-inducible protein DinB [Saprospiraceae bacterium]|jgi:uncharacterized damage-inducible protein DinB|tara:strand:+ start:2703 stop:3173 length:471 start_codon:yes stop_codon:yes gene_type:complete
MRSKDLAKRFREVILDGKSIAFTNIKEQISDLTMKQATTKISSLNTLAALTFHLNYYVHGVLEVFDGGELTIRDKFSFDMEPINSEEDWETLRTSFFANAEKFGLYIDNMSDEQLESPFVKEDYGSYRTNINAMIEHCYYHFGQMVIIKKMVLMGE